MGLLCLRVLNTNFDTINFSLPDKRESRFAVDLHNNMMRKHWFSFKSILLDTLLFVLAAAAVHVGPALFKLKFRQWVYDAVYAVILLGLFAGIIQLLLKIRKPVLKRLMIVLLAAVYIFVATVITDLVLVWVYSPEFVTERDGKNMSSANPPF